MPDRGTEWLKVAGIAASVGAALAGLAWWLFTLGVEVVLSQKDFMNEKDFRQYEIERRLKETDAKLNQECYTAGRATCLQEQLERDRANLLSEK